MTQKINLSSFYHIREKHLIFPKIKTTIMKYFLLFLTILPCALFAQKSNKKALTHQDLVTWKTIKSTEITDDGKYVLYTTKAEELDGELHVYNTETKRKYSFPRGTNPDISEDGKFIAFKIKPYRDSIKAMKLREVKKEDMPNDTLAIYNLDNRDLVKIPNVQSYKMPKKWNGWLTYLREPEVVKKEEEKRDNGIGLVEEEKEEIKKKKESKKNGAKLTIRELATGKEENFGYVTDYTLAEAGERLMYYTTSDDTTYWAGVYIFDFEQSKTFEVMTDSTYGSYQKMTFSKDGKRAAFVAEKESEDPRIHPFDVFAWEEDAAEIFASNTSDFIPENYRISEHHKLSFSEDNEVLFFGLGKQLPLPDTTILDSDKANVEVWSSQDKRLYTQQNVDLEDDKKKTYLAAYYLNKDVVRVWSDEEMPEVRMNHDKTALYALGYNTTPYERQASWEGFPTHKDVYKIETTNGKRTKIASDLTASPRLSPTGKFITWYNLADSSWYAHNNDANTLKTLTNNALGTFYDELNDRPMLPYDYGSMGWSRDDTYFYIYDRYDIWRTTPEGKYVPTNLTNGRAKKLKYRHVRLDSEKKFFESDETILLHVFDEKTKGSGYATLNLKTGDLKELIFDENLAYGRRPKKAKNADIYVFTRENFQTFPNLHIGNGKFKKTQQITDINPQQKNYSWGSAESYKWTAFDGTKLEGTLVKPANFNPKKKYPMIVNFYERSSDRLNRHRTPYPHRSTINYAFYASKGYLIFNPDVHYKIGYPGESSYNCVVSGVEALIKEGFVDKDKIGAQGHSWGGYQVAHLATKTDIFACIESGAPVVNMTSAYGGIRWGSGLSRMFQYEHTQSRIGGTLWNAKDLYLENSPLFNTDKINTPILIMHNDKDGAVPWYQGIEWFVALRRLDKKAWMLNYNDEPHWPLKLPNRKDFNVRMQEFFDHYLMDAEMPEWMKNGVPAVEKEK